MNTSQEVDAKWFIESASAWLKKGQRAEFFAETKGRNCAFHRRRGRNEILRRFLSLLKAGKSVATVQQEFFGLRQYLRMKVKELPDGEDRWLAEGKMREAYSLLRAMVYMGAASGEQCRKESAEKVSSSGHCGDSQADENVTR